MTANPNSHRLILNDSSLLPWFMWFGPLLFFAYQFVIRVVPGLVMPELMQKFQINASSYGFFASLYYFGYAGLQIPVALFLDRFGPKKVISLSVLLCSFGTILLVLTEHWSMALGSRFLIGAGSAAGFLGVSKVISLWFPKEQYTRMVGLTFTFGLIGALYGGKPVSALINTFGWENVLMLVGIIGLALAVFIYLFLKDHRKVLSQQEDNQETQFSWQNLKSVIFNQDLLIIALANFLMVGALEGFADVWGVSYLMEIRKITKSEAALYTSTIFFGMLFGGPLLAYLAHKCKSELLITVVSGFLMALIFVLILKFNVYLNDEMLYILLFTTGILCCYQVLIFSIGIARVPLHLMSITVAFLNCINMLGGSFFHSSIGYLMDYFWQGSMENGLKLYETSTYLQALAIIPISAALGGILLLLVKRKKPKEVFAHQNI